MTKRIRTAILGYGRSGGTMHAGAIEANSDSFDMVAVCDIDPERREQATQRFGCPVYEDYHRMLEQETLDLVSVVTRSDQHCRMACDCLEAGVGVMVTKPWAVNESEAQAMIEAARHSGKPLIPWLPARWGAELMRLRELTAAGAIGDVFLIRRTVASFGTRCDWQTERQYGGGYLLNWGPHVVDQALMLGGQPVTSVYGKMRQVINPGDGEDLFLALMTLENGTVVQAEYTIAVCEMPAWIVQGNRGTILVRGKTLEMHKCTPARPGNPTDYASMQGSGSERIEETVEGPSYGAENQVYAEIAQAVRGERPFPVTPSHALALTRTLDAIRASDEQNRVVTL